MPLSPCSSPRTERETYSPVLLRLLLRPFLVHKTKAPWMFSGQANDFLLKLSDAPLFGANEINGGARERLFSSQFRHFLGNFSHN